MTEARPRGLPMVAREPKYVKICYSKSNKCPTFDQSGIPCRHSRYRRCMCGRKVQKLGDVPEGLWRLKRNGLKVGPWYEVKCSRNSSPMRALWHMLLWVRFGVFLTQRKIVCSLTSLCICHHPKSIPKQIIVAGGGTVLTNTSSTLYLRKAHPHLLSSFEMSKIASGSLIFNLILWTKVLSLSDGQSVREVYKRIPLLIICRLWP